MIVLSLFDGIACGLQALKQVDITVTKYYASEIDKHAIKIAMNNHPEIIQLGDINSFNHVLGAWLRDYSNESLRMHISIEKPDLIIGGSPCQGFSLAGKQLGFDDPRSKLFFKFVEILKYYNPKYFLLENVRMKQEHQDFISNLLGVQPICINSSLVSAQNRVRYYWTNIPNVTQPEDKHLIMNDILESPFEVSQRSDKLEFVALAKDIKGHESRRRIYDPKGKAPTLLAASGGQSEPKYLNVLGGYNKLTPSECERLQTLPDNYTQGISNHQRYKALGNAWTVSVIEHIFKGLK
jgi:site-specific DNA-cytosine methylase